MATVAIDISPKMGTHAQRGIGAYTTNLADELVKGNWPVDFKFFTKAVSPPPASLIHYPYFDLFFHTLPIKKTTARGVTIHDVIPLVFPEHFPVGPRGKIAYFLQKLALKNTDFIICDSQASKRDIVQKLDVDQDKIAVIYLAAGKNFKKITDNSKLNSVSKKLKLPQKFVLYVGDVNWNKNVQALILAISKIKIPAVLVGSALATSTLHETREIDKLARVNNISSLITKTGFISANDLAAVYNLAEVTVLPSFYEGFGLSAIESMACGTPVVCSKISSLAEIAKDAAIFISPHDPQDIAQKIEYVLNLKNDQKETLSKKLQKNAARFSWEKTAQKTVEVYQKYLHD